MPNGCWEFSRITATLIVAAVLPSLVQPAIAEVRVWQDTLMLPATVEGRPDPNPPFDLFAVARFNYPYTLREDITDQRRNVPWRAVYLENEYLKCSVLPDLGGHLYTCIDKISGQPMFYANPSIKKARIGYRGAWAAFGIEFNFPVSHNWVSMSPVDFSFSKNPDGSASVLVGNIDRPYGMQWTVELRLQPGSTILEEHVTLYNRSDVRHRFYWWNNAAVRVWDDSRICYPMRWTASHGFTHVDTWPVDSSGVDLSIVRNQTKGPVSLFVHGSREPFMGVYHPHTNTGVVHFADYGELPGKKIWSWGADADGLDWRRALSDDDSAYVEVQAGLMRNQETYAFLEPRQSIRFTEYWMPVRGTGGIARANLAGVVNLHRQAGKLVAAFNANSRVDGANIRIRCGTQRLYETTLNLSPERTWSHEITAPDAPVSFEMRDASGSVLLQQTEGQYDWSRESEIHVGDQPQFTAIDPVEIGRNQELNGDLLRAYETYATALKDAPDNFELRVAAGRLAATLLRYSDAVRWLKPAQARATYDPEIAYHLGIAYEGLGRVREARTEFETAQRAPSFHVAGRLKLAELLARDGDVERASEYLDEIAGVDARADEDRIALRGTMKTALPSGRLTLLFSDSTDAEHVLAIGSGYMRIGLWRDALTVLSRARSAVPAEQTEPGVPAPQRHPVVAYYRAFCKERLGEPAAPDYDLASKLPLDYVFPNGAETLAVLEAAVHARPQDASAHFLLGSVRMSSGLVDEAIAEWKTARRLNSAIRTLHADLGRTLLYAKRDPQAALEAFRAGMAVDADNAQLYSGLQTASGMLGRPAEESIAAFKRYPDLSRMPAELTYDYILSNAEAAKFDDALSMFEGRFFAREEGGTNVRQVWIRVRTMQARWNAEHGRCDAALGVIDHLNQPVGNLAFTRDGLERFIAAPGNQADIGIVEARCGRLDSARERLGQLTRRGDPASIAFAFGLASDVESPRAAEWTSRIAQARMEVRKMAARDGSWWNTIAGMLADEAGDADDARPHLQTALLAPDRNQAHHYARELLRNLMERHAR
jgi:tetratricopeptide (TPR) repeat protein